MLPKISIITPSYNQVKFIEKTIKSVVSQNYPNLEYIIKDAGSTDNTLAIIKKYAKKYTEIKWVSKRDRGQADGINQGIKISSGEIIAYLNSDDMHTPKTLDLVGKYFAKNPDAMWLSGDYTIINERGKKIQSWIVSYKRLFRSFSSFQTLAIVNYIPQPSTFWRRELMENIGYYDESLHLVLDYDYWLRAIQKYPLHKTSSSLSFFRIHGQAKGTADYQKQFTDSYKIIKRYTNSPILLILHKVHALLTIIAYKILK